MIDYKNLVILGRGDEPLFIDKEEMDSGDKKLLEKYKITKSKKEEKKEHYESKKEALEGIIDMINSKKFKRKAIIENLINVIQDFYINVEDELNI